MHTLANLNNTQFPNEMQINVQVYWFTCKPTAAPFSYPPPSPPHFSERKYYTRKNVRNCKFSVLTTVMNNIDESCKLFATYRNSPAHTKNTRKTVKRNETKRNQV